ncbi:hypothetical protein GCM10027074_69120 [Streptomyces deserti]
MSKIWFITGSSRGFGRQFVQAALGRGDKVAATARTADSLAGLVAAHGEAILPLTLDVTNFYGALWVTQAALPLPRAQGSGHIVQISSVGGVTAFPNLAVYNASKWALESLSGALAQAPPTGQAPPPPSPSNCPPTTTCVLPSPRTGATSSAVTPPPPARPC